jgi:hypothetical protein
MLRQQRGNFAPVTCRGLTRQTIQRAKWLPIFVLLSLMLACTSQPAAQAPTPEAVLQAIPAADPAQYDHVQNMKQWRNPYLIIRKDGIALYDSANSAEMLVKPEEVLGSLARLPASYWPYGRVVAAAETATPASEQDGISIRRNKGIVGGILEDAHVAIKWVSAE